MRNGREVNLRTIRRGSRAFALLWVLGLLVLIVPLLALAAQSAMRTHVAVKTDVEVQTAHDLLVASERPIISWLQTEADHVVLPIDEANTTGGNRLTPLVLDDSWTALENTGRSSGPENTLKPDQIRIRIVAYDQCGMVPFPLPIPGTGLTDPGLSALRASLPDSTQGFLDQVEAMKRPGSPGLDWFMADAPQNPAVRTLSSAAVFPASITNDITELALQHGPAMRVVEVSGAVGAYVSPRLAPDLPITVNVNTAPFELLNALYASWGRGGLEQIVAKRNAGDVIAVIPPAHDSDAHEQVHLVTSSSMWAFRIDVTVNAIKRSWWSIYARQIDTSSFSWKCVQRLAITE